MVKSPKVKRKKAKETKQLKDSSKLEDGHKSTHQEQLLAIAEHDPAFLEFLKQQDADLLQFDESDVDTSSEDEHGQVEDEIASVDDQAEGKPPKVRFDPNGRRILDGPAVNSLREAFVSTETVPSWAIRTAVKSLMACVARVGADVQPPDFVINEDRVFDAVVRLCLEHLGVALLHKMAHKQQDRKTVMQSKQMKTWSGVIKQYLNALILFVGEVQNADVVVCCLRAMGQVAELYAYFARLCKQLIKSMVRVWSRKALQCRVAAMVVLCKLVRVHNKLCPSIIKTCYLGYVSNVRDVCSENLEVISFMQQSFAQLCQLNPAVTYPYAFVYIRQTAIHLRNAMIAKRKELIQTVYNWQYMECLYLWTHVILSADQHNSALLTELVYPLTQIVIATLSLFPSIKYLPLRMHCVKVLLLLQVNCNVYVPALSLSVQLLHDVEAVLKKKPCKGKGSSKAIDMSCIIKASSSQLEDAGFREAMLDELFRLQLEAAYVVRASIAFPDLVRPLHSLMKQFVNKCPNATFLRLFKSMASKFTEHAAWVDTVLARREVQLNDQYCLASLEATLGSAESPLAQFHDSWTNIWRMKKEAIQQVDEMPSKQEPPLNKTRAADNEPIAVQRTHKRALKTTFNNNIDTLLEQQHNVTDLVLSDSD